MLFCSECKNRNEIMHDETKQREKSKSRMKNRKGKLKIVNLGNSKYTCRDEKLTRVDANEMK